MRCLIDHANMVNLFWSEKCGCTYIKTLYNYYVRGLDNTREPHTFEFGYEYSFLDPDYKNILIIRNPYHRFVSGYYDKYIDGHFTCDVNKFTFEEFVDYFEKHKFDKIDFDHFSLQFSRAYNENITFHKIFDINNFNEIDFLDQFSLKKREYDKSKYISRSFYSEHTNEFRKKVNLLNAFKTSYEELSFLKKNNFVPYYDCFYNQDLKNKIYQLYEFDFNCLDNLGFKF